jgi:16S rRNA (adenine1518-N6/adenine1519-N6)-dimethyltransferase
MCGEEGCSRVGPGNGALTRALLDRGQSSMRLNSTGILCDQLADLFCKEIANRTAHRAARRCNPVRDPPFDMICLQPALFCSSKITFRLLDIGFEVAVLMYQSEFAERMVAPAGTKDCGRLSIMVQTYAAVQRASAAATMLLAPAAGAFHGSEDISPRTDLPINDRRLYADMVRALFSHRRKTVRNCLKGSVGSMLPRSGWTGYIAALPDEILKSRPEALYLEDFATIANIP